MTAFKVKQPFRPSWPEVLAQFLRRQMAKDIKDKHHQFENKTFAGHHPGIENGRLYPTSTTIPSPETSIMFPLPCTPVTALGTTNPSGIGA